MDVVMQHQAGITNSFATMGTALSEEHIHIIKRFALRGVIAYDGDTAGTKAAFKAAVMFMKEAIDVSVVILGEGSDPADFISSGKADELKKLLSNGKTAIEFCVDTIISGYDILNPFEKSNAFEKIKSITKQMQPIIKEDILKVARSKLGMVPEITPQKKNKRSTSDFDELTNVKERELELIKTAISIGTEEAVEALVEIRGCFFKKKEIDLLAKMDFDNEELIRISLDEKISVLQDFEHSVLLYKIWCMRRFLSRMLTGKMSNIEKIKKIREAQAKIEELEKIERKMNDRKR